MPETEDPRSNASAIAYSYLLEVSDDESWINGCRDGFAHRKLTELLAKVYAAGAKHERESAAWQADLPKRQQGAGDA